MDPPPPYIPSIIAPNNITPPDNNTPSNTPLNTNTDFLDLTPKPKMRIYIPFPCYSIDITDFPRIRFVSNAVIDGDSPKVI